ncbi:MAG: hypothetical protein GX970_04595 [Phyllobacteriaceae bacterium]|nr:hypothetical protein [Phyllobacteriaceae bacterium]
MPPKTKKPPEDLPLVQEWTLPLAATLGSDVRAKGILLELRARLPLKQRKRLDIRGLVLALRMAEDEAAEFEKAGRIVTDALVGIDALPVVPREIEDILSIKTSERHRWLKDGRLVSVGTRTVKLRGRARKITFHVFDPRMVEDLLNRDQVENWREEDALATAEKRRQAAWKAKLKREEKKKPKAISDVDPDAAALRGWEDFMREGLLHD